MLIIILTLIYILHGGYYLSKFDHCDQNQTKQFCRSIYIVMEAGLNGIWSHHKVMFSFDTEHNKKGNPCTLLHIDNLPLDSG